MGELNDGDSAKIAAVDQRSARNERDITLLFGYYKEISEKCLSESQKIKTLEGQLAVLIGDKQSVLYSLVKFIGLLILSGSMLALGVNIKL